MFRGALEAAIEMVHQQMGRNLHLRL
jgi:hypothetical protein